MTMPSPPTTMTLTAIAILLLGSLHVEAFMSSRIVLQRPVQVQASFLPKLKRPSPKELLSPGLVLRLASGDGTLDGLYNITSEDISNCVDTSGVPSGSLTSPWVLPNSFELFLTQCSIQSFVFLLKSLHDPHTVMWVESFTQPSIRQKARPGDSQASQTGGSAKSKLLTYHGLAAFNTTVFPTWDSYFSKLLEQPMEMYIIESHSGLAPEYELEIKPASLCARIVSVREQIAREFVRDLGVIAAMGGHTLESHWESLKENREIQRENLFFLEMSLNVGDMDYAPSPLRKGNFDLLVLLTTQVRNHSGAKRLSLSLLSIHPSIHMSHTLSNSHITNTHTIGKYPSSVE
jgi:hypothetical protein